MWGASARAHVHASFARWCLHARSSIADQGVILVCLASGCFAFTNGVTIFDLVSSSSFDEYYKAETSL